MIILYNIAWIFFSPLILLLLIFRVVTGKEDILRIFERLGIPSQVKPTQNIILLHTASVGECKIGLTLARHLSNSHPNHKILITTGTVTSAQIVRKNLNGHIIHQYIPLDNYLSIWLFFKYWQPKICILVESELWPNLIYLGSKICPILLVNARMSDKSFSNWQKYKFAASTLFSRFKAILCQSAIDHKKYIELGAHNAIMVGNLKFAANKLDVDPHNHKNLLTQLGGREIFLAASTHPGDEKIAIDAHILLRKKFPNLITIIAPRHINRAEEIKSIANNLNLSSGLRSKKDKISAKTDIYIADTMGELGLLFSVAKATFMGGSFIQGGHNLIEPAYFNSFIIFGPNMTNCQEVADEFLEKKAAFQIHNKNELVEILDKIYSDKLPSNRQKTELIIQAHANIINNYLSYIHKYLR